MDKYDFLEKGDHFLIFRNKVNMKFTGAWINERGFDKEEDEYLW